MILPAGPSTSSTRRRFCRSEPRKPIRGSSGFPGDSNGLVSHVAGSGSSDWHMAASAAIVNKRLEEPEDCPTRITG
jgi:hypothetical protein